MSAATKFQRAVLVRSNLLRITPPACHRSTTTGSVAEYTDDTVKPFNQIPGPKSLPWLGRWLEYKMNPSLVTKRHLMIKDLQAKYGNIVREDVVGYVFIHLFDPDHVKQVYVADGKTPEVFPLLAAQQLHRKKSKLAPGLGNSNGQEWYKLRAIIQQMTVRPQSALDYLPDQNEVANDFLSLLDSLISETTGEVEDTNDWFARWSLESSALTLLNLRCGFLGPNKAKADAIIASNHNLLDISTKLYFALPFYTFLPTPKRNRLFASEDFVNGEANRLVEQAFREMESAGAAGELTEDKFRFLSYLLGKSTSQENISAVARSMLTDTLGTTAVVILSCLYLMARNPEAQDKVLEEGRRILDTNGDLTKNGYNGASYTKAVLRESMRFFPVGIDVQRVLQKDLVIGGYHIPKGTYVLLEPSVAQHLPSYISEPEKFLPERWMHHQKGKKNHPYLSTPFSIGPRMCAGRRFAEQELTMMLSKLVQRYRLEWHHPPLTQRFRILQDFGEDVRVKFVRR